MLGKPLLLYGLLEVGIGIYAIFLPALLSHDWQGVYPELTRQLSASFYVFSLIRFLVCFLLILLPTTLMGATLPVLSRFMVEARKRVGKDIGYLYAINTMGATLGCLVTGFYLIESPGRFEHPHPGYRPQPRSRSDCIRQCTAWKKRLRQPRSRPSQQPAPQRLRLSSPAARDRSERSTQAPPTPIRRRGRLARVSARG